MDEGVGAVTVRLPTVLVQLLGGDRDVAGPGQATARVSQSPGRPQ